MLKAKVFGHPPRCGAHIVADRYGAVLHNFLPRRVSWRAGGPQIPAMRSTPRVAGRRAVSTTRTVDSICLVPSPPHRHCCGIVVLICVFGCTR